MNMHYRILRLIFENENGITRKNIISYNLNGNVRDYIKKDLDPVVILNKDGIDYFDKKIYELKSNDEIYIQEVDYYVS